jgi:hypothetical protein
MNIYLVVRAASGKVAFFDGQRLYHRAHPRRGWPSWVRSSPGSYAFRASLELGLDGWPPGDYTWYLLFTDARRTAVLGRAAAEITVEPEGAR